MTEPIRQTEEMGQTGRGREGAHWTSLSSPFLRFTHAARWRRRRRRSPGRSRKQSGERNKLSRSIDCSALCLLCLLPFRSLVARSSRGSLLYKSYGFSVKLSCFWRSPSSLSLSLEQSPIYTTATASERASDSAQFSGFYAPEPSKEASVVATTRRPRRRRASDEKVLMYVSGKSLLPLPLPLPPSLSRSRLSGSLPRPSISPPS